MSLQNGVDLLELCLRRISQAPKDDRIMAKKFPKKYFNLIYALLMSIIMGLMMAAVLTAILTGLSGDYVTRWLKAFIQVWPVAFPILLILAPFVRKLTAGLAEP
jgi:hypothetical protein